MKRILKILVCLSIVFIIIITTLLPCFALVDNNSTNTGYITNIASRVDILSYSDKLSTIKLDNTVDVTSYDKNNLTVHYNGNNGWSNNTSNITSQVVHKQYNGSVSRIQPTSSYAQLTVAKGIPPSGIFNNYGSFSNYLGGNANPLDTPIMETISPGTDNIGDVQNTYGLQSKDYTFIFDDYYYDPNISSTDPCGTLSFATYVVVEDSQYEVKEAYLEKFFDKTIRAEIAYFGSNGEVYATYIDIEPYSVSSHRMPKLGNYDYCIVNVSYRYEHAINEAFAQNCSLNGIGLSRSYITSVPRVQMFYTSTTASVGGVSGQGYTSPMIFSFTNFVYDSDSSSYEKLPSWGESTAPSDTNGLFGWFADTVGGILDVEFFGRFSLGDLLGICVGIGIVFIVLKIFAGG